MSTVSPVSKSSVFQNFKMVSQDSVIQSNINERTIINAGPGTGKTWTLIEKLIYMLENPDFNIKADEILVFCFSRSAIDVIESRLREVSKEKQTQIFNNIEVRTFDSFATYIIAWLQKTSGRNYYLSSLNYEQRIELAIRLLKDKLVQLTGYKHFIVDEVQDLVGYRAKLVLQILNILDSKCGFTLFGDSCQAIYDWDNQVLFKSNSFYSMLFEEHREAHLYSFQRNYRQQQNTIANLTVRYRNAILSGITQTIDRELKKVNDDTSLSSLNFAKADEPRCKNTLSIFKKQGNIGILTRTNAEALKISFWLRKAGIEHKLQGPASTSYLDRWIADIFMNYNHSTISIRNFEQEFKNYYPAKDNITNFWQALINSLIRDSNTRHYDVKGILEGLKYNAKSQLLYTPPDNNELSLVVSTIHRSKGREYDTVLITQDIFDCPDQANAKFHQNFNSLQEHKICYVALTRPRINLRKVQIAKPFVSNRGNSTNRYYEAKFGKSGKRYLKYLEVGLPDDIEKKSFAIDESTQNYIRKNIKKGTKLQLIQSEQDYNVYVIVPDDHPDIVLGWTSTCFAENLEEILKYIFGLKNCRVYDNLYPFRFTDVYVDKIITCIGVNENLDGAVDFDEYSIWTGFTISGFAERQFK